MALFESLRARLGHVPEDQIERIQRAFVLAQQAHEGQFRHSGEPYIIHPVAVAELLADMRMDVETILAGLLHDVVEDTHVSIDKLGEQFGPTVALLVDGVTKIRKIKYNTLAEAQAANLRKMLLAMSRDPRVIIIKMADRLHNMRTTKPLSPEKRRRKAKETLDIYAPIAKRLGMRDMATELEELGFQALYPLRYRALQAAMRRVQSAHAHVLDDIKTSSVKALKAAQLGDVIIQSREKPLYSIYRKMRSKRIPFNDLTDVYAIRFIVQDIPTCYQVLGVVHTLFRPVFERFKDYIASPKPNNYQSLHTVCFGPVGVPIEVQIRTEAMDKVANVGVAAHWMYKLGEDSLMPDHLTHTYRPMLEHFLELQEHTRTPDEYMQTVKHDLEPEELYVFTPKGHIVQLPAGATALDFAYHIGRHVGHHAIAARVDRRLTSLSTVMSNGQTVEIITSQTTRPSSSWLHSVSTSKARSEIQRFLREQARRSSVQLGSRLLGVALKRDGLALEDLTTSLQQAICHACHTNTFDDVLSDIGLGHRHAALVSQQIKQQFEQGDTVSVTCALLEQPMAKPSLEAGYRLSADQQLVLNGTEGMMLTFASCCRPIPGDPVLGWMHEGSGLSVHREGCPQLKALRKRSSHPVVPLCWADDVRGDFPVVILADVLNQRGVFAMITMSVSDAMASIEDVKIQNYDGNHAIIVMRITVRHRQQLADIFKAVRRLRSVTRVWRLHHDADMPPVADPVQRKDPMP